MSEEPGTTAGASTEAIPGRPIVRASWWGTAVFAVTAVGADVAPVLKPAALAVASALFLIGCLLFAVAFLRAAGRSRYEAISVFGLFFLSGCAPRAVRWSLLGSLAAQVVVALVTAAVRPYTSLAAGTLVPVYALSLSGLWGARYGTFEPL